MRKTDLMALGLVFGMLSCVGYTLAPTITEDAGADLRPKDGSVAAGFELRLEATSVHVSEMEPTNKVVVRIVRTLGFNEPIDVTVNGASELGLTASRTTVAGDATGAELTLTRVKDSKPGVHSLSVTGVALSGAKQTTGLQVLVGGVLQTFSTAGEHSFAVPAGVSALLVRALGAGGGGGAAEGGGGGGLGGAGGGAELLLTVTAGEVVSLVVGAGGAIGDGATGGAGGGGGGYSSVSYQQTLALLAPGGGGGGGGRAVGFLGGDGGGGGGATGAKGAQGGGTTGLGGGGGTATKGGDCGHISPVAACTGKSLLGGIGGNNAPTFGNGGGGGKPGGGNGASGVRGGGGGGGGYFGGGGAGGGQDNPISAAGGGGGGSGYVTAGGRLFAATTTAPGLTLSGGPQRFGFGGASGRPSVPPGRGMDGAIEIVLP